MGWRSTGAAFRAGTYNGPLTSDEGGFASGFASTFAPAISAAADAFVQTRRDEREHERTLERIRLQETLRTTRAAASRSGSSNRADSDLMEWVSGALEQYDLPATQENIAILTGIYNAEGTAVQAGNALAEGIGNGVLLFDTDAPPSAEQPLPEGDAPVVDPASVPAPAAPPEQVTPVAAQEDDLEAAEPLAETASAIPAAFNPDDTALSPTPVNAEGGEVTPADDDDDNIIPLGGRTELSEQLNETPTGRAIAATVGDLNEMELFVTSVLAEHGEGASLHDQAVVIAQRAADVREMQTMDPEQLERIVRSDPDEWRRMAAQQMLDIPERLNISEYLSGVTTREGVASRVAALAAETRYGSVQQAAGLNALLRLDETLVSLEVDARINEAFINVDNLAEANSLLTQLRNDDTLDPVVRDEMIARAEGLVEDYRITDFQAPEDQGEAQYRYGQALASGDEAQQRLLLPYINATLQNEQIVEMRIGPEGVSDPAGIQREGVNIVMVRRAFNPDTGEFFYRDIAGNPVTLDNRYYLPVTEEERSERASVISSMTNDLRDYRTDRRNLFAFADLAYEMSRIVAAYPAVTTTVAGIANAVVGTAREVGTAYDIASRMFSEGNVDQLRLVELEQAMQQSGALPADQSLASYASRQNLERILGQDIVDLAEARRVFEAMAVIATFRAGGLEGQSGQAMSNRDFERLSQFLTAARTPEGFRRSVGSYLRGLEQGVLQRERDLLDDPRVNAFESTYYYNPLSMRGFEETLQERGTTQEALNYFFSDVGDEEPAQTPDEVTDAPAPEPDEVPAVEPEQTGAVSTEQGLTPREVVNAYGNGRAIEVTEALQQAYPQLQRFAVGTIIRNPASN